MSWNFSDLAHWNSSDYPLLMFIVIDEHELKY